MPKGAQVGAGGHVGDTVRDRVTAEVSHVYFYSAACLCGEESQLKRHIKPFLDSYQQIRNQICCKRHPLFMTAVKKYRKSTHCRRMQLQKDTRQTQISKIHVIERNYCSSS